MNPEVAANAWTGALDNVLKADAVAPVACGFAVVFLLLFIAQAVQAHRDRSKAAAALATLHKEHEAALEVIRKDHEAALEKRDDDVRAAQKQTVALALKQANAKAGREEST